MRRLFAMALFLVLAAIAFPVISLALFRDKEPTRQAEPVLDTGPAVNLLDCGSGEVISLPLEDYVVGVVAAEMPAAFPMEALKAQAVAARTYTLKRLSSAVARPTGDKSSGGASDAHPQADICSDYNHCQAWIGRDEMLKRWGKSYNSYYEKICTAVSQTRGQAVYYNNALIDPVYHSTSNGRTENSEEVWGGKIAYLRSVSSRWDTASPKFHTSVEVSLEDITKKLGSPEGVLQVSSVGAAGLLRPVEYTSTGRLKTVSVANKTIPCTQLRQALGLPSTDLTWKVSGGKVVFSATGNGHGVGMSQYGAKGMALEGSSWEAIIKHYYTGVELKAAY